MDQGGPSTLRTGGCYRYDERRPALYTYIYYEAANRWRRLAQRRRWRRRGPSVVSAFSSPAEVAIIGSLLAQRLQPWVPALDPNKCPLVAAVSRVSFVRQVDCCCPNCPLLHSSQATMKQRRTRCWPPLRDFRSARRLCGTSSSIALDYCNRSYWASISSQSCRSCLDGCLADSCHSVNRCLFAWVSYRVQQTSCKLLSSCSGVRLYSHSARLQKTLQTQTSTVTGSSCCYWLVSG